MTIFSNKDAIKKWSNPPAGLVESFGDEGDFIRQYLLSPLLFRLLENLRGKKILDAGCGQGYLCRMLVKKGAFVTGIEPADKWFSYAQQREKKESLGILYIQDDLSTWNPTPESFDIVIANMVLMDIPDFISALQNCIKALKKEGKLLFSILHPCFEESGSAWTSKGFVEIRDYFKERIVKQRFGYFIHRQLSTYINSVIQAGCVIQEIIEPQLDEKIAIQYQAERYANVPGYIMILARKNF